MILYDNTSRDICLYSLSNLDLINIITHSNALTDQERARLLITKRKTGEFYNLTRCFIIITKIKWGELIQKATHGPYCYWVYLKKRHLEGACGCRNGDLNFIIQSLEKLSIIKVNRNYLNCNLKTGFKPSQCFSQSYAFTEKYRHRSPCRVSLPYTISPARRRFFGMGSKKNTNAAQGALEAWLEGNVRRLRLHPDVEDYKERRIYKNEMEEDSKAHAEMMIEAINAEEKQREDGRYIEGYFFNRKNRVHRVYTPIIGLHKDMRHFLHLERQELWEVDQQASQPFLMLGLYRARDGVQPSEAKAEADHYYSLWGDLKEGADFYRSFINLTGMDLSREEMKSAMIKGALNCKNVHQPPQGVSRKAAKAILLAYANHFPILYRAIRELKTMRDESITKTLKCDKHQQEKVYSQYGIKMQQIESSIFIDGVAMELMEKGIFCYTCHDAIGCLKEHVEAVQSIIEKHVEARVGYKPAVRASRPALQALR